MNMSPDEVVAVDDDAEPFDELDEALLRSFIIKAFTCQRNIANKQRTREKRRTKSQL